MSMIFPKNSMSEEDIKLQYITLQSQPSGILRKSPWKPKLPMENQSER